MHWLNQPISAQPIILVVEQQIGLARLTNSLVKTTNIRSTNYIGCRATNGIGQGLPIHWLKQPISGQPIILVVEQSTGLIRGNQCIG